MQIPQQLYRKTYALIDLDAIRSNVKALAANMQGNGAIMAVVKADAYGHGALPAARAAVEAGAGALAVAMAEEAMELRDGGITVPIVVMGHANPPQMELAVAYGLSQCVVCADDIYALEKVAAKAGARAKAHVKTDTGMGRIGARTEDEFAAVLKALKESGHVEFEGLFTHFACADDVDKSFTKEQHGRFERFVDMAKDAGFSPVLHAANSAACIDLPEYSYDYARGGISVYGYYCGDTGRDAVTLRPAMSVYAEISQIKTVPVGTPVGYGSAFVTERETKIATVQIGYGDGYNRLLSNRGRMIVNGSDGPRFANVVGRVCMDQTMIDVTGICGIEAGDTVVVMGESGGLAVSADDIAEICGTISYEVVLSYSKRVPRIYKGEHGKEGN